MSIRYLGPCGSFPPDQPSRCVACSRVIRCVYVVDDGGWEFYLGRRCYQRMEAFLR
jgi:hypothetical protein